MVERWANIDIAFRNGLKDLEVLPPQEVWDNIRPVISKKQRPFILLRAAALIAVILTMSFLAFRLSREISPDLNSPVMAFNNEESVSSGSSSELILPEQDFSVGENIVGIAPRILIDSTQELSNIDVIEDNTYAEIAFIQETKSLSVTESRLFSGPQLETLKSSSDNILNTNSFEEPYLPVNDLIRNTDRWSIAAMASPTYYSSFKSGNDELSKQLSSSEQPIISYTGGVAFSYKVNKRFSVQSGLFYSSVGQEVGGISSFGGFKPYDNTKGDRNFEVLTTNGTIYTNNADVFLIAEGPAERIMTSFTNDVFDPKKASLQYISSNLRQNFSYIELPIILRYKFVDKTLDFNLIGGLSYNMLVNNSVYTINEGGKYFIGKTEGLNMLSVSSSLGMGMEYSFSDKLSLNLEPTFRYYLNPFNRLASGSALHPYSFGIFSGISYKF
jgi:hypothetical protein